MKKTRASVGFLCATCGKEHDDLPDIGYQFPDPYLDLTPEERGTRATASPDLCIVGHPDEGDDDFVCGVIEIPIHDHAEVFGIGVWVSQSQEHYEHRPLAVVVPAGVASWGGSETDLRRRPLGRGL